MKIRTKVTEVTEVTETSHIHPLTLRTQWLPIIVTDGRIVIHEPLEGGEPFTYKFRPELLRDYAELPHLWATMYPSVLFDSFYRHYEDERDFTFTGHIGAKELKPGTDHGKVSAAVRTMGFKRSNKGGGKESQGNRSRSRRRHYLLDMRGFIPGKHVPPLEELYELAIDVRNFCVEMGIGPKSTFAGIAAAMLRHPRFYPNPRKRVPEFINEKARIHLPGNHYDLFTDKGRVVKSARYYDQRSAHHHAAIFAPAPSSDSLRAKGFTRGHDHGGGPIWLTPDHPKWNDALNEYGLYMVRAKVPAFSEWDARYLPNDLRIQGVRSVPIWSSELPWIQEMGISLVGIEWALTGDEIDKGIQEYAKWALEETAKRPHMKQALLTPYGLLAQRRSWSRAIEGTGHQTVRWELKTFDVCHTLIGDAEFHSYGPTNVLQRGVIEAYTRMLTLRFVSRVPPDMQLGLYGDAVIIETDKRQFIAPDMMPFRNKGELTNLEFLNEQGTQFVSEEMTRLPGNFKAGINR